ncbi:MULTISPECIES: phage baseplate plug family protein [unclassified Photorhabdus]|uniref:phage baseplate plug family protein n=1 Tax=unclassified Photorhabdus TaxID=2620880 RepID=UPI000DCD4E9E|nr:MULTISPECIES: hypothetical protein [unclassified Photorhabdus]RAW93949.1 hypothetical protein CKY03_21240 [Photorhabdus sp. S9-53]RAW94041.1 hypothetical protein CKY05_21160 [Photorhabdus sp. S10-54]RAW97507.1 hypothetical protein CKY04_21140 [Photorhabdus sp. S8-52]
MNIIPLTRNAAYQKFSVTLNNHQLVFYLSWLTRYGYFVVDIINIDNSPMALGRALHVGVNLLADLNTDIGKIVLEGETPTISNLGIKNQLKWYPI